MLTSRTSLFLRSTFMKRVHASVRVRSTSSRLHSLPSISSRSLSSSRTLRRTPNPFPQDGFDRIDESISVEEEKLPFYEEGLFYPIRIGELIRDQYQIVAKLGYGASATVWLALDFLYLDPLSEGYGFLRSP